MAVVMNSAQHTPRAPHEEERFVPFRIVREIFRVFQRTIAFLVQQLHQERIDRVHTETTLRERLSKKDRKILEVEKKIGELSRQLKASAQSAEEQRLRANGLEGQLAVERWQREELSRLLQEAEAQGHILRGKIDCVAALKDDIQRQLNAANSRIADLDLQIVQERVRHQWELRQSELRIRQAELSVEGKWDENVRMGLSVGPTVGGGTLGAGLGIAGGPLGIAVGWVIGASAGAVVGVGANLFHYFTGGERGREEELRRVNEELEKPYPTP